MNPQPRPQPPGSKRLFRILGILVLLGFLGVLPLEVIRVRPIIVALKGGHHLTQDQLTQQITYGVGILIWLLIGIWLVQKGWGKNRATANDESPAKDSPASEPVVVSTAPSSSPTVRNKRWTSCSILHVGAEAQRLWHFDAKGSGFALKREHRNAPGQPLPFNLVAKSWRSLFQPRLNVAWLPPDNVFFRVVELPRSSFEETLAMVELQLEKLSPLPITQVVWMIHVLSGAPVAGQARPENADSNHAQSEPGVPLAGDLQTVVVVIAARHAVEEFLGKLEGQGYLADRLEAPLLDELEATPATEDGAWIYPAAQAGHEVALVAWRFSGVLRNLSFIVPPPTGDRAKSLKDQLAQLAWAGELEGWLTASPTWHLVADGAVATEWENLLRTGLGEPVQSVPPQPAAELAARTARRAAQANARATLLPGEFSTRYHQQFVDRLWLRGLIGVGVLYVIGVAIYLCATQVLAYRAHQVERQVAGLTGSYTNTLLLEARCNVLRQRQDLKYAALDCWQIVAEQLPAGLSLQRFSFSDGQTLSLNGIVPSDKVALITDHFYDAVRKAKVDGKPMFDVSDQIPVYSTRGNQVNWRFSLPLKQHSKELP